MLDIWLAFPTKLHSTLIIRNMYWELIPTTEVIKRQGPFLVACMETKYAPEIHAVSKPSHKFLSKKKASSNAFYTFICMTLVL